MKELLQNITQVLNHDERKSFIRLILADILLSLLDIAFLAILLFVVQFYTHTGSATAIFPVPVFNDHPLLLIITFFFLFSVKNLFGFRISSLQFRFRAQVASRLSHKNILQYLNGDYTDYVTTDSSVQIRKISQQPIEFCHYILGGIQQIIGQIILISITIIAILIYNPILFPLLFAMLAPPVIITGLMMRRKLNVLRKTAKPVSEKTLQYLQEGLAGYVESNLYGSRDFFATRYHQFQKKFNNFLSEQQSIQNLPSRLIEVFAVLGLLILVFINTFTGNSDSLSLLTIGAFMAGAYKIIPGIVKILNSMGQIRAYEFTLRDLLHSKEYIEPKESTNDPQISSVILENISFDHHQKQLLSDLSLEIGKGELVGLSGASGRGKTTVINLMLGLIKPRDGNIYINETCLNEINRQQYWKKIAYMRQESFLIHDTILKNITLSEDTDKKTLDCVIRATGLGCMLSQYPEGLETVLTENGKNISGGQRQLIALARALYKKADLIILDEPFNELDHEREIQLMDHFSEMANAGKLVLLVTHHKKILNRCTKIVSLDEN